MSVTGMPAGGRVSKARVRRRGVCPECQYHRVVRVSGVMAKHRSSTGTWCPGAGLTPIPVQVEEPDCTSAGYFNGHRLDRWDFLSMPMLMLLLTTRTRVDEVANPGFTGSIHAVNGRIGSRWVVSMPIGGDVLDHDLIVRGLLAAAHGVDISDWPTPLGVREA